MMHKSQVLLVLCCAMATVLAVLLDKDGNPIAVTNNQASSNDVGITRKLGKSTSEKGLELDGDKSTPLQKMRSRMAQSMSTASVKNSIVSETQVNSVDQPTQTFIASTEFLERVANRVGYTPPFFEAMGFTTLANSKRQLKNDTYLVKGSVQNNFENNATKFSVMEFGAYVNDNAGTVTLDEIFDVSRKPIIQASFDLLFRLYELDMLAAKDVKVWKDWALRIPDGNLLETEVNAQLLLILPSLYDTSADNKSKWRITKYKANPHQENLLHCLVFTADEKEETTFSYAAFLVTNPNFAVVDRYVTIVKQGPA